MLPELGVALKMARRFFVVNTDPDLPVVEFEFDDLREFQEDFLRAISDDWPLKTTTLGCVVDEDLAEDPYGDHSPGVRRFEHSLIAVLMLRVARVQKPLVCPKGQGLKEYLECVWVSALEQDAGDAQ